MQKSFNDTFKEIFRNNYSNLLFFASRLVGEDEAEDVVQDTFLELWKRQDDLEIGDQIQGFLYRVAYTKSINILKHRNIENEYSSLVEEINNQRAAFYHDDNNEVIEMIENKELRQEIFSAINELPERCRLIFKLSYLRQMKNKEIADTLDISVRTVEAHIYKALRFLRQKLGHLILLNFFFFCFFIITISDLSSTIVNRL